MRVLLTGASGFLGRYALESLHRQGIDVVTIGRKPIMNRNSVEHIETDLLANRDITEQVRKSAATHLLHLAWYAEHEKYWTSPQNLRWVAASVRLVEAFCENNGQQVVVAGTCAEYDWLHGYCVEDNTPLTPSTLYGITKDATRRLLMGVCTQYDIPCAWGRVFLPYGTGENDQRLIPSLIAVFQGKRPPFGVNATAYRDFLHASDVADAFITLLQSGENGAFNISSGHPILLESVVKLIARLLDKDPKVVLSLATERLGDPCMLVGENIKIKKLDWKSKLSLVEGLERTVDDSKI